MCVLCNRLDFLSFELRGDLCLPNLTVDLSSSLIDLDIGKSLNLSHHAHGRTLKFGNFFDEGILFQSKEGESEGERDSEIEDKLDHEIERKFEYELDSRCWIAFC